jgi:heat shock protein HtpX
LTSDPRAVRIAATFALPPALVAGVIAGLAGGPVAAVVVFAVLLVALAVWARYAGERAVDRALAGLGAKPADPVADARLCNLVDGLSISAGLAPPRLEVVGTDGLNGLAASGRRRRGVLVVTAGLLRELELIELEAVVAELLVQIRRGHAVPATMVVATFGVGRRLAAPAEKDALADQAGVTLTRYPPALAAALEKIEAKGAEVPGSPVSMAHLWLADPRPVAQRDPARLPLRERIEALREL